MKKAIILVSGGIDSSTVLAQLAQQGYEIYALSFSYLQRHKIEVDKITTIIKQYPVKMHKIVNIDLRNFGGSALTDDSLEVPKHGTEEYNKQIPITYVPARNTIFLSYALAFAEVVGAFEIFIGCHASDYENYPDCRPEYIQSFENMANLATKMGVEGQKISINAPLLKMTKTEIIAKGLELGVDYSQTISCYNPSNEGKSCGKCLSCTVRLEAFKNNNTQDTVEYQ